MREAIPNLDDEPAVDLSAGYIGVCNVPTRAAVRRVPLQELISLRDTVQELLARTTSEEVQRALKQLARLEAIQALLSAPGPVHHEVKRARAKPLPKYRDPVTGASWAGRGIERKWMLRAIEAGAKREDCLIPGMPPAKT